jgi:hypothetical protein
MESTVPELLRHRAVQLLVTRWLARSKDSWTRLPVPASQQTVTSAGPDPDRVLLVGSGISVGYGMDSHELALGGQLARQLTAITGRGTIVDVMVGDHMTVLSLSDALDGARLRSTDAIVATPGSVESLLLMPTAQWRDQVVTLLDDIESRAPASLHLFFVAIPPIQTLMRMPLFLSLLISSSRTRLNRVLAEVCGSREYATYVPFAPTEPFGRTGSGRTYARWAEMLAPAVSRALDAP